MKIFKIVLMCLGAMFLLGILAIGYIAVESRSASAAGEKFVNKFFSDFSGNWQSAAINDRLTSEVKAGLSSFQGQKTLEALTKLGHFKTFEKLQFVNYSAFSSGTYLTFDFVGNFENGSCAGRIVLKTIANSSAVNSLAISQITVKTPTTSS